MKSNLKFILFSIFAVSYIVQGFAQIRVTPYTRGNDVIFDAESEMYGSHTLVLKFSLQGYRYPAGGEAIIPVQRGHNSSVYKLMGEESSSRSYNYKYRYYRGRYNCRPKLDYPYLLPVATGKELGVTRLNNLDELFGKADVDSILGLSFYYEGLDTIRAIRSGQVVQVDYKKQGSKEAKGSLVYNRGSSDIVFVEHDDGTIVRYICITATDVLVEPGDRIIVGQPLAVFTKEGERQGLGIHLYYLGKDFSNKRIIPKFYTEQGLSELNFKQRYKSVSTKEILEKELTKKEKKKLGL